MELKPILLFSNIVGSLFLKDPFFKIIYRSQQLSLFLCGVGKSSSHASIYSVDFFSYSGPGGGGGCTLTFLHT